MNYLISYPKAGRTWLRVMIGYIISKKIGKKIILFNEKKITLKAGLTCIKATHNGAVSDVSYKKMIKGKNVFKKHKVLLMNRNIHDVLVSYYFEATKRNISYEGNIHDFIMDDTLGVKKILQFYKNWWDNREIPKKLLFLRYEDLRKDTVDKLKEVLDFFEVYKVNDKSISEAIEFASFQNMKKMEINKIYSNKELLPGNMSDEESFKVRKGKIGGYINYLNEDDIEYIDKMLKRYGCEFTKIINKELK